MKLELVFVSLLILDTSALAGAADTSDPTRELIKQKNTQIKEMRDIQRKNILKINELEACAKSNTDDCRSLNVSYGLKGECDRACGLVENEGSCKYSDYVALMITPRDLTASRIPACVALYSQAKTSNDELFSIVSRDCGLAINNCAINKRSKKIGEIEAHNIAIKKDIQDNESDIAQLIRQQQEVAKRVKNVVKQELVDDCRNCARSDSEQKIINAFPELFETEPPQRKPATKGN